MSINILILSAGRRVELTKLFQAAKKRLSVEGKIIAVDMSKTAPALYFADKYYIVPSVLEDNYIETLIDICNKESVSLIVPTIDHELIILAKNKDRIESETKTKVLVSSLDCIKLCRNKFKTSDCFKENCFDAPKTYSMEELISKEYAFPLFMKPCNGSGSINAFKINNEKELEFFINYIPNPLVQEYIEGAEYTVDVFTDFHSNIITVVPRERILVRSGEVIKGRIEKNRTIIDGVKRLIECIKPIGPVTVQCFLTKDNLVKYIEINPRFGGGAPMSIKAGADSPENIYRLLRGEELVYNENYLDNVIFSRFDDSIAIEDIND